MRCNSTIDISNNIQYSPFHLSCVKVLLFAKHILMCRADFHIGCIDQWLLTRRPFCPICKQDASAAPTQPAATETTPLLVASTGRTASVPVTSSASTQTSPLGSPAIHTTQSLPANAAEDLC